MKELRAPPADRLALSTLDRRELGIADFRVMENGAVLLTDEARKTVPMAWQARKHEEIEHPFSEERTPLGLLPHVRASLLARALRGDSATIELGAAKPKRPARAQRRHPVMDPQRPSQATRWQPTATLPEPVLQQVVDRPVPIDTRAG